MIRKRKLKKHLSAHKKRWEIKSKITIIICDKKYLNL